MRGSWVGLSLALAAVVACGGDDSPGGDPDGGSADGGAVADAAPEASTQYCLLERRLISDQSLLQRNTYEWDELGRLVSLEVDNDGDGTFNYREYRSYNDKGQLVGRERDDAVDGTIDRFFYYVRDPNEGGRLLYYIYDANLSNGLGWNYQWNHEYDVDGLLVAQERDDTPDPNFEDDDAGIVERRVRSYDGSGNLVQLDYDRQVNTIINYQELRSYDEQDRLTRQDIENQPGSTTAVTGTPTLVITSDYDDEGRLVQKLFDRDSDGTFDEREERFYECE